MTSKERFLSNQKRSQPISLPQEFSDEEMVRDWTLSETDQGSKAQPYEIARSRPADLMIFDRFAREIQDFSAGK